MDDLPKARVSMFIAAPPADIYRSFVEPGSLALFWLASASAPLRVGETVEWHFMVTGATAAPEATRLVEGKHVAWRWSSGTVDIDLEPIDGGTAVTLVNANFPGGDKQQVEAALNATEGFSIVLCDLKTLLESGKSAGLTRGKAKLIEARK
jgi:uncharacterized protein YndB with AHSA1/START domain